MLVKYAIAAASAVLLCGPAAAQNVNANPSYETVRLNSGFTPDPYTVELQSGGSIDASQTANGCRGYIANAPDVRLQFSSGSLPLIISVDASADTTLVINAPDGRWYCDDDSGNGYNPSVRFNSPGTGRYEIWVGTYGGANLQPASLKISELYSE
ncbi:MAG: hypothetical protein ABR601_03115 [Parasphingopyxis sp.]|nr:hypothetical protein [Sphingomonadales bacterium]